MKNLLISQDTLEKKLTTIEQLGIDIDRELVLLTQEIRYILSSIHSTETFESTKLYFDMLQKIQSTLSALVYREGICIKDTLTEFIRDFDRIDDLNERKYLFREIKSGEYKF